MRLANLRSGGLDLIERLLATDIAAVQADPKLKLSRRCPISATRASPSMSRNGDKAKNPLGQNAKVRQALELAIDREAINQVVFNGEFVPGNQWVSPTNPYYQKSIPIPKRDVAKAKALIKEAGVTTPIAIDFMVPQGAENKAVAEVVQAMAAEAGFDLKIRVTEFATSLKQAEQGEYQVYLIGWSGRTDPDGNIYIFDARPRRRRTSPASTNPEVDKALDECAPDLRRRPSARRSTRRPRRSCSTEGPILYLYHRKVLIAHTTKVEGFVPVPDGLVRVVGLRLK